MLCYDIEMPMKIMMISDSPDHVTAVQEHLKEGGTNSFEAAHSVAEAVDLLGAFAPEKPPITTDLILADDLASGINGVETCLRLKAVSRLHDIPVILMTSTRTPERLKEAFDAGAVDFIPYPYHPAELLVRVRSILKSKEELDHCVKHEKELLRLSEKLTEMNHTLSRLSSADVLTGVANRSRFDDYLDHEWKNAIREATGISLLLIDLDYFSAFNDRLGSARGDECLRLTAKVLEQNLKRPGDLVARFSGGMFAGVMTHADPKGTAVMADLLRLAVNDLKIEHPLSPLSQWVTVSVGGATTRPQRKDSLLTLIVAAEQALYQAKKEGRNCSRQRVVPS